VNSALVTGVGHEVHRPSTEPASSRNRSRRPRRPGDPRHVLRAWADPAAQGEPEDSLRAEQPTEGESTSPCAGSRRVLHRRGRAASLPPSPGRARRGSPSPTGGLVDGDAAGVAVVAVGRPAENAGTRAPPRTGEDVGGDDAAVAKRLAARTAPRPVRDAEPARLTTASTPSNVPASIWPAGGSQPRSSGPAAAAGPGAALRARRPGGGRQGRFRSSRTNRPRRRARSDPFGSGTRARVGAPVRSPVRAVATRGNRADL
jgi:hypothetical protein